MTYQIDLKEAEKQVFHFQFTDGLWDILLGCIILLFAVAPLLSDRLGDFWSSMIFLPFWALVYFVIRLVRKRLVTPRLGSVKYGPAGKDRLRRFSLVMLVLNAIVLILGIIAFVNLQKTQGNLYSFILGFLLLGGFSLAAFVLSFNRLYFYALLAGISPLIGAWLWAKGLAAHHGFPIMFGVTAIMMILVGAVVFVRFLHDNPVPPSGMITDEAKNV